MKLAAVGFGAFVLSHVLALAIGAWPSVLFVAALVSGCGLGAGGLSTRGASVATSRLVERVLGAAARIWDSAPIPPAGERLPAGGQAFCAKGRRTRKVVGPGREST